MGLLLLARAAAAGECLSKPERFELISDTVHWNFSLPIGAECLQGLRGKTQLLERINVVEPPRSGQVVISGPSFRYQAAGSPTNERFKIAVEGENKRQHGTSLIVVDVTVK
ncbi:hypothetical protein QA640_24950 [Bradyrhizobium sp. CB82]|uniref:hypothetical protein n=1 Tax=Bradyrhizobium sp. CB82 TaxID=3039159 RepID=UPI0024B1CF6C|nr:hypothetical protein [Bradyrhizobium sp. CB82]WFU37715.1 hypothetical protein QA640_24950 [Bradyrhizobium sp. CB82]